MRKPRDIAVGLINFYQGTLSPDHGPLKDLYPYGYCRHEPTCSEYAKRAITDRGLFVSLLPIVGRVLTCHPWKKISPEKILKVSQMASQKGS
jgi:putative component of membrane protein insertase Oxa1/YidC/SpoIIIJ protein YidD